MKVGLVCLCFLVASALADTASLISGTFANQGVLPLTQWTVMQQQQQGVCGTMAASVALNNAQTSDTLTLSGFGFTIPPGSTIQQINVVLSRKATVNAAANVLTNSIALYKTTPMDQAFATQPDAAPWVNENVQYPITGNDPLWGTTWAVADVNSPNFGLKFNVMNTGTVSSTATIACVTVNVVFVAQFPYNYGQITVGTLGTFPTFYFGLVVAAAIFAILLIVVIIVIAVVVRKRRQQFWYNKEGNSTASNYSAEKTGDKPIAVMSMQNIQSNLMTPVPDDS